ncbi:MAG: hypothetical protein KDD41_07270 [Flavobacteriales bacterium]|nr:hypothetical protein [Flavobacteriales bacterium]
MTTEEKVKAILLNGFIDVDNPDELRNDTPLISNGVLDSISILQLIDVLEKEFQVEFAAHEIDKDLFDSIDKITHLIAQKKS